ncbi:hypothetical protein UA08_01199 [Talaromyces atroroseus]|uniref:Zn(2)-C6 fungal-type domain-containing protein n=1 Tax=Talaromyces atroroseus TaxID=1441469 RepID=A0A1Q5QAJ8_TALAT|nr:hypothetical protein UA08_01199 [Talaromyces atroroseus]OKL62911.1 hypothetical protein UA08_01199 [Talaromyces atroroseus]
MDRDPRLRTSKDDVEKNISFSSRDAHSNAVPSYAHQSSTLSSSLAEHGLRHNRATADYFSHISPGSSSDHVHGSTPASTGNAMVYDAAIGEYLNEMSMGMSNDGHDTNDPLADLKRPRACEACRQLKVRCEPDNDNPAGSCKRCAKAKRKCVVTAPTRKRQKKTDSRVSDLEKKIDALTASLQVSKRAGATPPVNDGSRDQATAPPRRWLGGEQPATVSASPTSGAKRTFSGDTKSSQPPGQLSQGGFFATASSNSLSELRGTKMPSTWQSSAGNPSHSNSNADEIIDVIDRGLIDFQTATDIFNHYVEKVAPTLPIVIFPAGTTMSDVRHNKPILFHAIMTLSIAIVRPELQMSLVQEVHRIFADRVVVKGEKSLELVQSIMLACIWYTPPDQFEELKFFQFIHLAVVMAMDIGMGRVTRRKGGNQYGLLREIMGKNHNRGLMEPDAPETRRIWLGAYFMAVNAAMALRRPLLCRWLPYMDECIEILRNSPEPSDKILIHWAKLSHIAEEIGFQFSMDDPTSNLSMSDTKVRYALKGFEKQLDEWRQEIAPENYSSVLRHAENIVNIYMHEIAMHNDHNIDDFTPPFSTGIQSDFNIEKAATAQIDALTACLTSIHTALDCILHIEPADLICLPTVFYARTAYAFIALLKMFSAISSDKGLARVFSLSDLKLEEYFDNMISHLKLTSTKPGGRTASRFSMVLNLLRNWFNNRKTEQSAGKSGERQSAPAKSEAPEDSIQRQTIPPGADSKNKQTSPVTNAASNSQQWSPYGVSTSEAASSANFLPQQYQFGQASGQDAGNTAIAGMLPTSQTEYAGLVPDFELPMPFDTATLFSMGDMIPDELFSLPFDGNGNLYIQ